MPPEAEITTTTDSTDTTAQPNAPTAEQEAQEEQDFAAGFDTARRAETPDAGSRPPEPKKTETPASTEPPKSEAPAEQSKTTETTTPPEDPEVPGLGMKASEVKAALEGAKAAEARLNKEIKDLRDSAMGHVGQLRTALNAMRTTAGQPTKVTKEQLKRISEEYPELAPLLAEDLSALVFGSTQTVDVEALQKAIQEKSSADIAKLTRDVNIKFLTRAHRDWRDLRNTPEFSEWKGTLPDAAQTFLDETDDGAALADAFDDFKAWKANGKKVPGTAPAPAADPGKKDKDKRLAANVEPRTSGSPPTGALLNDEDAFLAGFSEVSKQRGA